MAGITTGINPREDRPATGHEYITGLNSVAGQGLMRCTSFHRVVISRGPRDGRPVTKCEYCACPNLPVSTVAVMTTQKYDFCPAGGRSDNVVSLLTVKTVISQVSKRRSLIQLSFCWFYSIYTVLMRKWTSLKLPCRWRVVTNRLFTFVLE